MHRRPAYSSKPTDSRQAAALNQDFSFNTSSNPVAVGSVILLFGTGEGLTKEVTPQYFGGLFGPLNGFIQVNLPIPPGVGPGNLPLVIRVNGRESPPVTIAVK